MILVEAAQVGPTTVRMLVNIEHSASLYESLKKQGVKCREPKIAYLQSSRTVFDHAGHIHRNAEKFIQEIQAEGTLADFERWMRSWGAAVPPGTFSPASEEPGTTTEPELMTLALVMPAGTPMKSAWKFLAQMRQDLRAT
jgi:hypothetical protein